MVSFVLALNKVNVIAVTIILVLHVGVIGHYIPCRYDFMFPRRLYHVRSRPRALGSLWHLRAAAGLGEREAPQWSERDGIRASAHSPTHYESRT